VRIDGFLTNNIGGTNQCSQERNQRIGFVLFAGKSTGCSGNAVQPELLASFAALQGETISLVGALFHRDNSNAIEQGV
jgi:hypothetical protein